MTVILLNMENLYESLYDALNQASIFEAMKYKHSDFIDTFIRWILRCVADPLRRREAYGPCWSFRSS